MNFQEAYATIPGDGWLTEAEARLLWDEARRTAGSILEVGCHKGRSTCLLARLNRIIYAVDPFAGFDSDDPTGEVTLSKFWTNLSERRITNVVFSRYRIEDFVTAGLQVGFAYLDGDHTYGGTARQIAKALEMQPQGIGVHDVNDQGGGAEVRRAALELLGPWRERVERLAVWRLS